jgi:glutathione S-transferase
MNHMTKLALVLIGTSTSPFVRKVRLAAATLRLPLAFQREAQWSPETTLGVLNPLLQVPTLLTPDAGPVYDSRVIIAYLEQVAGVSLRPPEPLAAIIDQRIEALADGISSAIAEQVHELWRAEDKRSTVYVARQKAKVEHGVAALARDLTDGRLPREQVTAGVLATVAALDSITFWQPQHTWRTAHSALATWAEIWRALPHYEETLPVPAAGTKLPAL